MRDPLPINMPAARETRGLAGLAAYLGRGRACAFAVVVTAATSLAACDLDPTEPAEASFVRANIEGSIEAEYTGTGTFLTLPPSVQTRVYFSLFSRGVGAAENQSFYFHGRHAPTEGTYIVQQMEVEKDPLTGQYRVSEPEDGAYFASYEFTEGNIRRVFSATSGVIHVTEARTESAPRRVAGTFQLTGVLTRVCTIHPGFPGNFLQCEPATEEATVEIHGTFRAGPRGGDNPGLIPYPG